MERVQWCPRSSLRGEGGAGGMSRLAIHVHNHAKEASGLFGSKAQRLLSPCNKPVKEKNFSFIFTYRN